MIPNDDIMLNVTFELYNYNKQEWEEVPYNENIFDEYIIDSITRYECGTDWRFRLNKPNKLSRIREIVEEHFDITQDGTYCLSHSGTKLLKEVLDDD